VDAEEAHEWKRRGDPRLGWRIHPTSIVSILMILAERWFKGNVNVDTVLLGESIGEKRQSVWMGRQVSNQMSCKHRMSKRRHAPCVCSDRRSIVYKNVNELRICFGLE
jgi:hypothetical protein